MRVQIAGNYKGSAGVERLSNLAGSQNEIAVDITSIVSEAGANDLIIFAADPKFWIDCAEWSFGLLKEVAHDYAEDGVKLLAGAAYHAAVAYLLADRVYNTRTKERVEDVRSIVSEFIDQQKQLEFREEDTFQFGFPDSNGLDRYTFASKVTIPAGYFDEASLAFTVIAMAELAKPVPDEKIIGACRDGMDALFQRQRPDFEAPDDPDAS